MHRAAGQRGAAAGIALPPGVHLQGAGLGRRGEGGAAPRIGAALLTGAAALHFAGLPAPLGAEHFPPGLQPRRRHRHVSRLPQPSRDRRQPGLVLRPAGQEVRAGRGCVPRGSSRHRAAERAGMRASRAPLRVLLGAPSGSVQSLLGSPTCEHLRDAVSSLVLLNPVGFSLPLKTRFAVIAELLILRGKNSPRRFG